MVVRADSGLIGEYTVAPTLLASARMAGNCWAFHASTASGSC
ncbi:hypothetical protein [Amycolatopsis sp. H20-H5]|nr:hypothetical protein [Amycolatopsis sp. H20-H5]MEC3975208.1 hypothetical protein [Amycolatopsis sp. H20-H5]